MAPGLGMSNTNVVAMPAGEPTQFTTVSYMRSASGLKIHESNPRFNTPIPPTIFGR